MTSPRRSDPSAAKGGRRSALTKRAAAIVLPALPLQILLRDKPSWRGTPVAVAEGDGPDAPLLFVNEAARKKRLRPGARQGTARDLVPDLRTKVVPPEHVRATSDELIAALQTFSPRVEPDEHFDGCFFVDPTGLGGLYGGLSGWARTVHGYLEGRGLRAAVVVGFTRYRALALGRLRGGPRVLRGAKEERLSAGAVPLRELALPADLCDGLGMLGVETLGAFLALPAGELADRFGPTAARLHGLFDGDPQLPMQPRAFDEPVQAGFAVEPPDLDVHRLLFGIKGALHDAMGRLGARGDHLAALTLCFELEAGPDHVERVEAAAPTADALLILDLVRLRLSDVHLGDRVEHVTLEAEGARAVAEQLATPGQRPRRDLAAADRAIARLRAAYGVESVTRAELRPAHLPEARFRFAPTAEVSVPTRPGPEPAKAPPPLVRRVLRRPRPLAAQPPDNASEGPVLDRAHGTLLRLLGPYRVSGGWWVREVERDYYYAETSSGAVLWLYFDRPRGRWFLHGFVD